MRLFLGAKIRTIFYYSKKKFHKWEFVEFKVLGITRIDLF